MARLQGEPRQCYFCIIAYQMTVMLFDHGNTSAGQLRYRLHRFLDRILPRILVPRLATGTGKDRRGWQLGFRLRSEEVGNRLRHGHLARVAVLVLADGERAGALIEVAHLELRQRAGPQR